MKNQIDIDELRASDADAIFYQAQNPIAIEQVVKSAAAIAAERASTYAFRTPRELCAYITYQTTNILADTITHLQKAHDLIREDGRLLWAFPGAKEAIDYHFKKKSACPEVQS